MLIDDVQEKTHHVDTRCSQGRVDHHALTRLGLANERANMTLLFGDEWGNVCLETSCTETYDNDGKAKRSKCPIRMHDNRWNGRNNKNEVPDDGNNHRNSDSSKSPPLFVCNVGAQKGSDVTPITQSMNIFTAL